jgi:hypothetical protein
MRPAKATGRRDYMTLPGVACPCGSAELRLVEPGDAPRRHKIAGRLTRGRPIRGWCSLAHWQESSQQNGAA